MKSLLGAGLLLLSLGGCAGYHLGPIQPYYLRSVHKLAVPTFENKTLAPRISVLITDTVIKQLQQDGTYQIVGDDEADASLHATITHITRAPLRSVLGNVLATLEFNLALRIRYTVVDKSGKTISGPADVVGTTSFFVGPDITSDERQALPLAAEEMAKTLVSQLSEGW